ncbi:unnamed protein product, partial [Aureobasidium pullulans]
MATEADDDLQLIRASGGLLADLQTALSNLLWKRGNQGHVHHLVRSRDLDHVIQLLLDAHLRSLLPPIVEAYLAFLQVSEAKSPSPQSVALDVAASKLLYTFCKVRGEKIIIGFLNNEPRHLELILNNLENFKALSTDLNSTWEKSLIPAIYSAGQRLMDDAMLAFLSSSAVTKKLVVKLLRNIALLSLKASFDRLVNFFETYGVLEETIEYCLQSLDDRDTPVRFAASKALSMIILHLDPEMGHEVVQAVLESFKEDMPQSTSEPDFGAANALRWHGLTLTLAHALFRRSASTQQLPEILNALLLALSFEQRSAVGVVAIQLLLSACLDPTGNIRRGSSAALQELIGRHPDQVSNGIALVQVVDYHAVGLRQRAMVDVAQHAADLDSMYREALLNALGNWRGLGSTDIVSREAAAESSGLLCAPQTPQQVKATLEHLQKCIFSFPSSDLEQCHGSLLALSQIVDTKVRQSIGDDSSSLDDRNLSITILSSEARSVSWRAFFVTENSTSGSQIAQIDVEPNRVWFDLFLRSLCLGGPPTIGRVIALGAAFPWLESVYKLDKLTACNLLADMVKDAPLTEWRTVGLQAMELIIQTGAIEADIFQCLISALEAGLNDYTITERGDVGSLVRSRAIQCKETSSALPLRRWTEFDSKLQDASKETSRRRKALNNNPPAWKRDAILKGSVSCAGVGAEGLLRASRMALVDTIQQGSIDMRIDCITTLSAFLKDSMLREAETQPLLELVAYLLDALPSIVPLDSPFNWRVLLSLVQKSHFKSNNIPRILAAVDVYQALVEKPTTRADTLKKLASMLNTNPYPT